MCEFCCKFAPNLIQMCAANLVRAEKKKAPTTIVRAFALPLGLEPRTP